MPLTFFRFLPVAKIPCDTFMPFLAFNFPPVLFTLLAHFTDHESSFLNRERGKIFFGAPPKIAFDHTFTSM